MAYQSRRAVEERTRNRESGAPQLGPREFCRVVEAAEKLGVLSEALIAAVLKIPLSRARMVLGALESMGWIEPVKAGAGGCPCSRCPLARVCPLPRLGRMSAATVYRVTAKAREACRRLQAPRG